jgi:hypothetical protein
MDSAGKTKAALEMIAEATGFSADELAEIS